MEEWKDIEGYKDKYQVSNTGTIYPSVAEAERQTGIDAKLIRRVCVGKRKTTGGYHWKYINNQKGV